MAIEFVFKNTWSLTWLYVGLMQKMDLLDFLITRGQRSCANYSAAKFQPGILES